MRSHRLPAPRRFAIALLLGQLAACQAIAGIKDRHFDGAKDAGDGGGPGLASAALCKDYCSAVMDTCKDPLQVYPSEQTCRSVCMQLPAGNSDAKGNTVECRNKIAVAASNAMEGLEESCPEAGPGGVNSCGSDCESYCYLYARACPKDALDDCEGKCKGLTDKTTLDAVTVDHDGDTLQCRLVHVSNATVDSTTHCKHARLAHPEGYCSDAPESDLDCKRYCKLVSAECTGANQVYESELQCQAVCTALGPGKVGDQSKDPKTDSVACRLWHAYTAMLQPETHCAHAGPTGDGHCGDGSAAPNCAPYCKLLQNACSAGFDQAFGGDLSKCNTACQSVKGSEPFSGYAVKTAAKDPSSLQCRVLYVSRAVGGDDKACDDALGKGTHCHD